MEENITTNNADATPSTEATPNVETSSMESGGEMYDGSKKLGFIGIMLLGLTTASLIYSIYYYRKNVESLKKGQLELKQIKQDIDAMKQKFANATGTRTRYGRLA